MIQYCIIYKEEPTMRLDEKHKQFAVSCYAQFMPTAKVVTAFIEEFDDELPKPPPLQIPNNEGGIDEQMNRDEYIKEQLGNYWEKYMDLYNVDGNKRYEKDLNKINEQIEKSYVLFAQEQQVRNHKQHQEEHQQKIDEFYKDLRNNLSNNLRRYNITHRRFPNKYGELFYQVRQQYIDSYRNQNASGPDIITTELETIYGYIKQQIFQVKNPREIATHARLAHTILQTIDTRQKSEDQEQQSDSQPNEDHNH